MRRFLLSTSNAGKVREMRDALSGLGFELLSLKDIPPVSASPETGETFEENAAQKALHYSAESGLPSIADDSGIHVEALAGELGIHTRRWGAGPQATDDEWIRFFLERMHRESNKRARFVCVIALSDGTEEPRLFRGVCDGVITDTLESDYLPGLPLSACFKPDGQDRVFSALSIEQKNSSSHRGRALMMLREFLS